MNLLDSSTLTNQSIAATKLVHTYTATRSCMVMVRVFIDQLSANTGSRQVWLGLIHGGTGSEYRVHMITQSVSVVSSVTSIFSYYGPLPIANTDILKVYVIGVAGDTTTTDIITEIWEENYTLDTVWTSTKAGYVDAAVTSLATAANLATVDTVVDAIKAKTDNLPSDPGDESNILSAIAAIPTAVLGGGAIAYTPERVTDPAHTPLAGVRVWVTSDVGGLVVVANGFTNTFGYIADPFQLDAGTYYLWKQAGGYSFTNPETIVVT